VVSDKQWAEAQKGWIPLRQAVFVFGMTEDEEAAAIHDQPFLGLSKDDFEPDSGLQVLKKKLKSEANDAEIAERATAPYSRRQLTKMLKDQSGAHDAEIDPNTSAFLFRFPSVSGSGASLLSVSPWELERKKRDLCPEPRMDAEALFNKEGLVRISEEEAAFHEDQYKSARKAARLVFHLMLTAFARATSTKAVMLYAQVGAISAPFKRLPAHVWGLLEVADWESGAAIAPDNTVYWSIHADRQSAEAKPHSRPQAGSKIADFVKKYIDGEKAAGQVPTMIGCEKAAKKADIRGHRDRIRDAFREIQRSAGFKVKVGRPGHSPD
jgi:hypothetical protein